MSKQNTNEAELLPCPFCGGHAELVNAERGQGVYAACANCQGSVFGMTKEESTANWNTCPTAARTAEPIDAILFCPNCCEQHVDEAKPDICQECGWHKLDHVADNDGACRSFTAWLNPPHKSHRCNFCNHVWRPADAPTNGVLALATKGERDGDVKPKYFATTKDFNDAVEYARKRTAELERQNAILRKAVEHYAAKGNWQEPNVGETVTYLVWKDFPRALRNGSDIAQAALAEIEEETNGTRK